MITLTTEQAQQIEQAEQEPVAWQFFEDGKWWIGSEYNHHRQLTEEAGYPIRELYAAPVQQEEQEPFDMDDHPPHRLCECRKCMEYFTPLPDCDAFAASGKPIAGQINTQLMEGYRIGLAEMREKCAKVCEEFVLESNPAFDPAQEQCAAAIRAIKFEGDTGFRPVSEMIAEHKQDPKKAAAIEKAKMRKAKQEPVAKLIEMSKENFERHWGKNDFADWIYSDIADLFSEYAAPVQQAEQEPVAWGIDWGKDSDQSCVSIIKKHPNGTSEVVAVEYSEHPVSQEPVAWTATRLWNRKDTWKCSADIEKDLLYAARTKDMTDYEIVRLYAESPMCDSEMIAFARAVIAADREKNK